MGSDQVTRLGELEAVVTRRMPAILNEVRDQLVEQHPDYAAFLTKELAEIVTASTGFVRRLINLAEEPDEDLPELGSGVEQVVFEEIGRTQFRQGRRVTSLLSAYRVGARVAWRHVSEAALDLDVPAELFASLATTVFALVDQLSESSLKGYLQEQSDAVRMRERLRDELTELLLSDRADVQAVQAAALRAEWRLPRTAAVVLVEDENELGRELVARLDDTCLRLRRPGQLVTIVPDPGGPGRRAWLARALRGGGAVVGATVPIDRLPASLRIAEVTARLRRDRLLSDDPVFADEHLDAIIVHRDDRLLDVLRRRCLAPLDDLNESSRERLVTTLTSWLLHLGDRKAVAEDLHIHPQTVSYRLGRLHELFGPVLDDPAARATLLIALAWGPPGGDADPA
ncbi:CdaR family transcriptional regulator [Amycolatopsis sp. FDAARGOS 1241]|uniref:PucR family transcriptional regulator n=1 Tax=Amycolatopsis sp. FDAARGOS 1241 TaxID=2778070 RepID=UPI00194F947D|nr:helix-turn-helix domain-containing protein [Amycolatopsis sp. FDAARGOS 1241]QRP43394.1 helix-turn-helix domain-containing protein [Amycolatopsis sp. FDAARGOS 1241]